MGSSEKFCLRWNDFESNISVAFRELREEKDFFDCTLSCGSRQIQAHKLILSACSPFFRTILKQNPHQHPLLYLKGVEFVHLQDVLNFMYHGEVNVAQEELNSFLSVAEDLQVKGLTQDSSRNPKEEAAAHKSLSEAGQASPAKHQHSSAAAPGHAEEEIQEIAQTAPVVKTEPGTKAEEGMEVANLEQGYQVEGFNDYEVFEGQAYYEGDEGQVYEDYGRAGTGEHPGMNNFVIKTDAGFSCAECGKGFSDQSNCRRHVKNFHNKSNIYTLICNLCQKSYKNNDSLRHHQRATHGLYKQFSF